MTLNCIRDFFFFSFFFFSFSFRKANRQSVRYQKLNERKKQCWLHSKICSWVMEMKGRDRGRILKNGFSPSASKGLGGTVGHAFSRTHADPALSSWTDNWTVLWRIWTLKGNLSHLIIGIQRMPFICINTNKTHSLPAQREPSLKRKSYYKTPIFLWNWTKDYRK